MLRPFSILPGRLIMVTLCSCIMAVRSRAWRGQSTPTPVVHFFSTIKIFSHPLTHLPTSYLVKLNFYSYLPGFGPFIVPDLSSSISSSSHTSSTSPYKFLFYTQRICSSARLGLNCHTILVFDLLFLSLLIPRSNQHHLHKCRHGERQLHQPRHGGFLRQPGRLLR